MLMCMPELAFLLVPEATCNNTKAGTADAISTTSDYFHGNYQILHTKGVMADDDIFTRSDFVISTANIKLSHTAFGAAPNACVTLSLRSL